MPAPLNRLPCGQFFPGEFPRPAISTVGNTPVVPPVYNPNNNNGSISDEFGSIIPPGGGDVPVPGNGSPGGPGEDEPKNGSGRGSGPPNSDTIPPIIGPQGPGTGGLGGPVGRGPLGPGTGGLNRECKRCVVLPPVPCPEGKRGPPRVIRTLQNCTAVEASNDNAEANRRKRSGRRWSDNGPWNDNAAGLCLVVEGTLFDGCVPDPDLCVTIPRRNLLQEVQFASTDSVRSPFENQNTGGQPGGSRPIPGRVNSVSLPQSPSITFQRRTSLVSSPQEQRIGNGSQIDNSRTTSQTVLRQIPKKIENRFNLDDPRLLRNASVSSSYNKQYGLLDETYNLLRANPTNSTTLATNSLYLDVFNELVSEEVKYFLYRENTSSVWDETKLSSLTNEKIIISLNSSLLTAISNIHTISNQPISLNYFVSIIKTHLINGTMYEFDSNYYKHLFNIQIKDSVTNYNIEGESYRGLQACIGLFELSSNIADFTKQDDVWRKDDLKRTRFLLEDINSRIPAKQLNGNSSPLYLRNAGIPIKQVSQEASSYLEIGDGAGYYITTSGLITSEYPLVIQNDLSSARYIPPSVRDGILKILGTDIGLVMTVESPSTTNEFSSTYNPSADIYPMYFKLDFESIKDIENPNSVINIISATYTRISDEEAVRHSRNYSFNVTKINLDFRDPIIHYARDTSSVKIELDDFNFRGFGDNRSIISENIILRNIPAAVILTPGLGSAHNPFNGRSNILSFSNEKVVRSIQLSPGLETNQITIQKPSLEVSNIYKTFGESYYGLYEKYIESDIESDIYTFNPNSESFKKSYFVNSEYSNTLSDNDYIEASIESKIVAIVDKLVAVPGVNSLTWWDVFRRLEINDLGKLTSSNVRNIIKSLSGGWRNGVKIYNILSRKNPTITGLPEDAEIVDDKIILYELNRLFN